MSQPVETPAAVTESEQDEATTAEFLCQFYAELLAGGMPKEVSENLVLTFGREMAQDRLVTLVTRTRQDPS